MNQTDYHEANLALNEEKETPFFPGTREAVNASAAQKEEATMSVSNEAKSSAASDESGKTKTQQLLEETMKAQSQPAGQNNGATVDDEKNEIIAAIDNVATVPVQTAAAGQDDETAPDVEKNNGAEKDEKAPEEAPDASGELKKKKAVLTKDGYAVPESIKSSYLRFEGKYLHRQTEQVHFEDKGKSLATDSHDRKVIGSMIELAQAKNWTEVQLKGTEEFRREAWMASELAGIRSTGFTPTEQDHALLQVQRESLRISGGKKDQVPDDGRNEIKYGGDIDPPEPAPEKSDAPRQSPWGRAVTAARQASASHSASGILLKHGPAPYRNDPEQSPSYFVQVRTDQGDKTLWGIDLRKKMQESGLQDGQQISLQKVETRDVEPVEKFNKATGKHELVDAIFNVWEITSPDMVEKQEREAASVATAAKPVKTEAPSQRAEPGISAIRTPEGRALAREAVQAAREATARKVMEASIATMSPEQKETIRAQFDEKMAEHRRNDTLIPVPQARVSKDRTVSTDMPAPSVLQPDHGQPAMNVREVEAPAVASGGEEVGAPSMSM